MVEDGNKVKRNKVIAKIKGKTKSLLIAERTALNFLSHSLVFQLLQIDL